MGKHKDKEKKRPRDDSSEESDSSGEERDHKKAKKHRKEKHKKEKKGKKDEKSEKKLLKEAKAFLKGKLKEDPDDAPLDPAAEIEPISADAYFEKNPEFTAWLREERQLFFGDLPTADARQLFDQFVAAWNGRRLKRRYYRGMAPAEARRSQHSWAIRGGPGVEAVKLGMAAALEEEREAAAGAAAAEQAERRRWKADQKLLLEEMLPKATGREARVEQRAARREEARAREASPDVAHLPGGGDPYGGDDSFAAARAREAQRAAFQQRRQGERAALADARLREAAAREDGTMAQFRALVQGGPIQIPKRQP